MTLLTDITYRDANKAFDGAIAAGRLSADPASPIYAGNYMYMGTWGGADRFKHCDTRQYLPAGVRHDG